MTSLMNHLDKIFLGSRCWHFVVCTTLGNVNAAEMNILPVGVKDKINFHYIFLIRREIPIDT